MNQNATAFFKPDITKDEINTLPIFRFDGEIVLVRDADALARAATRLKCEKVLGFDTETKPSFRKGNTNKPALIQLAGSNVVFLFQLRHIPLDDGLGTILSNAKILKTGVAIGDDMKFLQGLHDFTPAGVVDLSAIAKKHRLSTLGLRGLAAAFLGVRISKSVRCSNWGHEELTPQQITYAATDAWVSRNIYLRMYELGLAGRAKPAGGAKKD